MTDQEKRCNTGGLFDRALITGCCDEIRDLGIDLRDWISRAMGYALYRAGWS